MGARVFFVVCVRGPFAARGNKGKKSTPSVGWEVPVKSSLLASKDLDRVQVGEHL
jgi:hypothetical protein